MPFDARKKIENMDQETGAAKAKDVMRTLLLRCSPGAAKARALLSVGFSWNVCSASVRSLMLYSLKRLSDVSTAKWLGLCWCQDTCRVAAAWARLWMHEWEYMKEHRIVM